jgi:NADH-quinone oxidoreductase subunit L
MTDSWIIPLAYAILLLPLVSSVVCILATRRRMFKAAGVFTTALCGLAFVAAAVILVRWLSSDNPTPVAHAIPWIPLPGSAAGWLYLGIYVDALTVAMLTMVTLIATLVHLYSIGYMEGDSRYHWFFAYLSLFTFSMLGIVLANSIIMLFVFWELVGLTSYLLIGFWFEKRGPQLACKKAFVMNRVGDAGFLIGFGILFYQLGGKLLLPGVVVMPALPTGGVLLDMGPAPTAPVNLFVALQQVLAASGHSLTNPPWWLTLAGIGLFFGAIGKSAQFPLHTWLPDAMEGPTPVSSIVHSATMVAAGVYLTARIYPILTPAAHLFVATIGLITLVLAACMALVMTDIKRVLAYSTLSQLGYMILGLGAGAYAFALFHLITHAFFKCCLFQCSGSVIHAMHHEQDMRRYGGLARKMPITALCYGICTLAIAGASIPYLSVGVSGFYSKDGILAGVVNYGHALAGAFGWWGHLYWLAPMITAYVTVFYMARSFALTFLGKPRDPRKFEHAHEAPWTMTLPQVVLAALALSAAMLPFLSLISDAAANLGVTAMVQPPTLSEQTFTDVEHKFAHAGFAVVHAWLLHGWSWIIVLAVGLLMYRPGFAAAAFLLRWIPPLRLVHHWFVNKFYFDALYDTFLVGLVRDVAAGVSGWFDKFAVDGVVNLVGNLGKLVSELAGLTDRHLVDGAVNGAAAAAQAAGSMLRTSHSGRIRGYILLVFGAILAMGVAAVAAVSAFH